jgi:hypothetical protein
MGRREELHPIMAGIEICRWCVGANCDEVDDATFTLLAVVV